jgi:hypothetical protein
MPRPRKVNPMFSLFILMKILIQAGKILGWNCEFFYAHAQDANVHKLPASLKGSDMLVYEVLRVLGFEVLIRPIPREEDLDDHYNWKGEDWKIRRFNDDPVGSVEVVGLDLCYKGEGEVDDCDDLLETWGPHDLLDVTWLNGHCKAKYDLGMTYIAVRKLSSMKSTLPD